MIDPPEAHDGIATILSTLDDRFDFDANGRMVSVRGDGVLPRFVLGRSAEGCLWRFRADLDLESVKQVAKLASREPGIPIAGNSPSPPPERLVMIERILAEGGVELESRRETVTRESVDRAELWTVTEIRGEG